MSVLQSISKSKALLFWAEGCTNLLKLVIQGFDSSTVICRPERVRERRRQHQSRHSERDLLWTREEEEEKKKELMIVGEEMEYSDQLE